MLMLAAMFILSCLLLQAFFAGSEMAVISSSRIKVRHRAKMGSRRAGIVQKFLEDPKKFLATTLVGYNVAVVAGSCVLNNIISLYAPRNTENIVSLIIYYPFVLIGGQIIPMALGRQYANKFSLACARPLKVAYWALYPLVLSASALANAISRVMTKGQARKNPFVTREEIELMLKESHEAGILEADEKGMIEEIFHFGETTVREVMVPLIDVTAAPDTATAGELRKLIADIGHSRLPIYSGRIDNVIGTIRATDLVGVPAHVPARELARAPYIVPESASLETVLLELQSNNRHIAVVVDEYGGVSGVLTLEDIIEEIVGEIDDEYDTGAKAEWEKKGDAIIVDGRMRIEMFNRLFDQHLPAENADTVGGFITDLFGRIPHPGSVISFENISLRVLEATDRRVKKVEIKGVRADV